MIGREQLHKSDSTGRSVCCLAWFKYVTKRETNSLYMSSSVRTGQGHLISFYGLTKTATYFYNCAVELFVT